MIYSINQDIEQDIEQANIEFWAEFYGYYKQLSKKEKNNLLSFVKFMLKERQTACKVIDVSERCTARKRGAKR